MLRGPALLAVATPPSVGSAVAARAHDAAHAREQQQRFSTVGRAPGFELVSAGSRLRERSPASGGLKSYPLAHSAGTEGKGDFPCRYRRVDAALWPACH
jgi:hypothetical protein